MFFKLNYSICFQHFLHILIKPGNESEVYPVIEYKSLLQILLICKCFRIFRQNFKQSFHIAKLGKFPSKDPHWRYRSVDICWVVGVKLRSDAV